MLTCKRAQILASRFNEKSFGSSAEVICLECLYKNGVEVVYAELNQYVSYQMANVFMSLVIQVARIMQFNVNHYAK